ncbi:hypothetical protein V6N11_022045 [Hibiscus sabdariffa]|uniref:YDG domain-containing protein n=1 Tax=Hibiscus sabdariffa TaxID=183260 RepID=A0ABR2TI02_9ROSI
MCSAAEKDGNKELVENVLIRFDALRRQLSQIEDAKESHSEVFKRANLKGSNIIFTKVVRTNGKKQIGVVPDVEIGDIFFFLMKLILVGLHSQSMAGIDFMPTKGSDTVGERVAVSIVSYGGCEDPHVLVCTGQGGNDSADKEAYEG